MSKLIYGYAYNGRFIEVGRSKRGAKMAATMSGSDEVGYRSPINNMYIPTDTKVGGKWRAL